MNTLKEEQATRMSVRRDKLSELHADSASARQLEDEKLYAIAASLEQLGQVEPLVVRMSTGNIIGGNGSVEMPCRAGETELKVVETIEGNAPDFDGFRFTQASKHQFMEGLNTSVQRREAGVLDEPIRSEMESFEFETTRDQRVLLGTRGATRRLRGGPGQGPRQAVRRGGGRRAQPHREVRPAAGPERPL